MIKNIIFDMGQVIVKYDPAFFIERIGINDVEDKEKLLREIYHSIEWSMIDHGLLDENDAYKIIENRLPDYLKEYAYPLVCEWYKPLIPIQGAYNLVRELKEKGYHLFLLTNACKSHPDYWQNCEVASLFEDTLVSSLVLLLKPQAEIYHLALNKFNIKADETLFIDDNMTNCEMAVYCGLHSMVFHGDYQEIREKMNNLGIEVKL